MRENDVVLVVDDCADWRESIREALEDLGHQVIEASNGQQAFNLLVFNHDVRVKLIVLDLEMPIMNGWDFLNLTRSYVRLASIPVVIVSGYAKLLHEEQYPGLVGCLQTPCAMPTLTNLVQATVGPPT
jgi:CheY-like chemotaxis protein